MTWSLAFLFVGAALVIIGIVGAFATTNDNAPSVIAFFGLIVAILGGATMPASPTPTAVRHEQMCAALLHGKPASDTLRYAREFDCPLGGTR